MELFKKCQRQNYKEAKIFHPQNITWKQKYAINFQQNTSWNIDSNN